ncbi:ABC transporter permease [Edaphobacter acidisoli]|uniref:ABC transporter permease n=1 Tax=Edaphobacter acidisoli TaxID=2040573 RepID=A0A916RGH1_9BACT|nr:FtsX-like permease family protein [Edaphobacter acidisoli]GGA55728.1 ABC transporter permease [Edaphobacter acidisoli]
MAQLSFTGMLRRSLVHRRARSLSALVAMTVSAAIATALLTLYADLNAKLHKEFRSFGANVVITAPASKPLPIDALALVQQAASKDALAAEFGYAVATTDKGTSVVVAGTDFAAVRKLDSWWQVDAWPSANDTNAALIGQRAANFISDLHAVKLTFNGHTITLNDAGTLRTGGDEDSRIYMPVSTFTQWTGVTPSVIEVQIPGGAKTVEAAIARLRAALPDVQVQPVRELVEGESRIVDRTHALMYGAVLLIALTVAVSVLATLSASVLERRRDFALMKALGGSQTHLMALFLLEALALAIAGVVLGYIIGSAAAWVISETNFHTATLPHASVLPWVVLLNIVIAAIAALFPVRVLRSLQPAALLKGE